MQYRVDTGGNGPITIGPGAANQITVGLVWAQEIAAYQWYRLSMSLNPSAEENPPGTSLSIVSEIYGIQGDGQQATWFTIVNNTDYSTVNSAFDTAAFTLNVVSTPGRQ